MKFRLLPSFVLLLALLTTVPLAADDTLSLEQARAYALAHSKTLQNLLLSVDSALLDEKIQSYTLLPSITASTSVSADVPEATLLDMLGISGGVTITQTVFDGGKSALLSAIDSLSTSIARAKARAQYFSVLSAADSAFYSVLEAEASVAAAQSDLDDARIYQSLAQAKLEVGIIARSDFLKTESETAAKETALAQAQGKLSVARRTLASLTGLSLSLKLASSDSERFDELMKRVATFTETQTGTLIANLVAAAAKNNPTLSQSNLANQQARSQVDLAKADYLPSISASWTNSLSFAASTGAASSALSVSASLPLDMWNTQAAVDSKAIAARQAALDLDETQRTLNLEIEGVVFDSISSAQSVISSQKALDYAESSYQSVLERYKLSSASSSDLSDAELLVSTNRTALITARYQFLSSISSLRAYAGVESDDLLLTLVP